MTAVVPFGVWPSPINASLLVEGAVGIGEVVVDGDDVYWSESRPGEGGRTVVVRRTLSGEVHDVVPEEANVRTSVHEYGGAAWHVADGRLIYADHADQRLRSVDVGGGSAPIALTSDPTIPRGDRYADGRLTPDRDRYVCVRERHAVDAETINEIVAVEATGSAKVAVLVTGPDFVAYPRVSPDGRHLAWIEWNHPNMPWDDTTLVVAELDGASVGAELLRIGEGESFSQPEWSDDGVLHVVSDRDGWWHVHRIAADGSLEQLTSGPWEVATPSWVFGLSRYSLVGNELWFASTTVPLSVLDPGGRIRPLQIEASGASALCPDGEGGVVALLQHWQAEPVVARITRDGGVQPLSSRRTLPVDARYLPRPTAVVFPTTSPDRPALAAEPEVAHGWYHPPTNPDVVPPEGDRPPLLVLAHGGPTGSARTELNLGIAFWTSRGFGVVDVDYRGSTGYGRAYRERLRGQWGILDVEDCVAAVNHLTTQGLVDGARVAIKGGSAGGYTVLCALTWHDRFAVGATRYGIADLEALAEDTHKFESRYLDLLVGPYPDDRATYRARSPIHHTELLSTPMIVLQGLQDHVVPPNQAEMMVEALAAKGLRHRYVTFAEEGHGFREAGNIVTALEAELAFFVEVLGLAGPELAQPGSAGRQ